MTTAASVPRFMAALMLSSMTTTALMVGIVVAVSPAAQVPGFMLMVCATALVSFSGFDLI